MAKSGSSGGNWVTINGVHVLIGADGKITKGPAKFIGSTVADLSGSKESSSVSKSSKRKHSPKSQSGKPQKDVSSAKNKTGGNSDKIKAKTMSELYRRTGETAFGFIQDDNKPNPRTMSEFYHLGGKSAFGDVQKSTKPTKQAPKYPEGIETTAQKRAYTRAINKGKTSSEAFKIAKDSTQTISGVKFMEDFHKYVHTKTGRHISYVSDDVTERLLKEFEKSIGKKKVVW